MFLDSSRKLSRMKLKIADYESKPVFVKLLFGGRTLVQRIAFDP